MGSICNSRQIEVEALSKGAPLGECTNTKSINKQEAQFIEAIKSVVITNTRLKVMVVDSLEICGVASKV